jgi:hypothetical protein
VLDKSLALLDERRLRAEWLSFDYHFESMARGVIDLRDVLFFSVTVRAGVAFRALNRGGGADRCHPNLKTHCQRIACLSPRRRCLVLLNAAKICRRREST